MDLVYFIEDLNKKVDCTKSQQEANFQYLLQILPESIKDKKITIGTKVCSSIIKSGARRFQICGHPCVEDSEFCISHSEPVESAQSSTSTLPSPIVSPPIEKGKEIRIRKNKYGHFLFPGTKLIFTSAKDKTIKGVQNEIGECVPLREEDIKLCEMYHLRVMNSCKEEK